MRKFRSVAAILLIFMLGVFFSGCDGNADNARIHIEPLHIKPGVTAGDLQQSTKIKQNIDLIFDTSVSMRGYLFPNHSRFYKVLDGIKTTAETMVNRDGDSKVAYYQFGERFEKLANHEAVTQWNSYNYSKSNIDLAIKNANLDHLTVIVSDLAIESDALDKLINRLGSEYISKGYAIGILGIKSEYEGYVYDLEKENDRVVLLTDNKEAKDSYPFYLLILGNQANISEFYENLKYFILEDFPQEAYNFSLFPMSSRAIITHVGDGSIQLNPLNEESQIFVQSEQFVNAPEAKRFKINRVPKGEVGFNFSGLNCETLKYIPQTAGQLINQAELYYYEQTNGQWTLYDKQEEIIRLEEKSRGTELNTDIIVSTDNMRKGVTYAVSLTTSFTQGKDDERAVFEIPGWVKEWTTDKSLISVWKKEYALFAKENGEVSNRNVADKYRSWLTKKKITSEVNISTTNDLDKLFKKISYYIEKDGDTELNKYIFYITKQ